MLLTLALSAVLGASPKSAPSAVDSVTARAREAKARGDAALDSGQAAEALKEYEDSWSLKADPALLYNEARAYQAMGQYPKALELLERFIRDAPLELKARVPQLMPLLDDLRDRTCMLGLQVSEDGAEVRLKDRILGTTPLAKIVVSSGPTKLEVRKEGFQPYVAELDLPRNGWLEHEAHLVPVPVLTGTLAVETTPSAQVRVDSKLIGGSPIETLLSPGAHSLLLSAPDFQELATSVVITAGERKQFAVSLVAIQHPQAWYQRWYVWTIVGAVVAAGIAASLVATLTERPFDKGSLGYAPIGFR